MKVSGFWRIFLRVVWVVILNKVFAGEPARGFVD
jgi:hypothetical protein